MRRDTRRDTWPDPAWWIWRRLTSVKWAIGLILAAALFSAVGVIIPQVPPQLADIPEQVEIHIEAQRPTWGGFTDVLAEFPWFYETNGGVFNLYKQPYWYAVVALVALAISVCTVSRAPPIWRTVRRPPRRVNAAYFDRARHRAAASIGQDEQEGVARDQVVARLRAARYRVEEVSATDGEVMLFADRYGWAQLATFVTHLALLLLLGATLVTKFAGEEYQFWGAEGESHILFPPGDDRAQVQVIVDDAVARFADNGQALDFRSFVRVAEGGREVGGGEVTVNGPVHAAGYRVHQAAYWEHGAELRVFDHSSGQLLYAETHFLDQQIVGPRVRVERNGAVVSEEVISLQHQVADEVPGEDAEDVRVSGYTLIPLDAARSLAVTMVPAQEGYEFWYRVILTPATASGLTFAELGVGQDPPLGPRLVLAIGSERLFEGVVSLEQAEGEAMLSALPLTEDEFLLVGLRDAEAGEGFFYYSQQRESDRGLLAVGETVELSSGVSLTYQGVEPDRGLQGRLDEDETRLVGSIQLTWLGAESVFYEVAPDIPGADGDVLIALERFGQARTAEQFDALGGEGVRLATASSNDSSAGGQVARPSRMILGLGGDAGRIELDEGQEIVHAGLRYQFAGPREFTGLNVRRDPGGLAFWVGVGLGLVGMTTTFFMPRRRVWARVTADRVQLAGQAGHGIDLTSELERLVTGEEPPKRKLRLAPRRGLFGGDYAQPEDGRRDDA
ncbi:MAG: hypothetical protein F4088_02420 [Chloroflexi bacterium]|nr:hypothetical protein [Chloroflexota bacterium]